VHSTVCFFYCNGCASRPTVLQVVDLQGKRRLLRMNVL
jgi:hypothetical protein